jgi:hypothetical protein
MNGERLRQTEHIICNIDNQVMVMTKDFRSIKKCNCKFGDFVDRIYHIKLEIKDTTDTDSSASCVDLHLEIDSEVRLKEREIKGSD